MKLSAGLTRFIEAAKASIDRELSRDVRSAKWRTTHAFNKLEAKLLGR